MSDDTPTAADLDLLGLTEGASVEDIERAYRRERALYAEDSLATYALLDGDARSGHLADLDEAYRKVKLAASLSPVVPPRARPARPRQDASAAAPAAVPAPVTPVGEAPDENLEAPGATLAALRAHKGLPLSELARRTRIRSAYLEALEQESYKDLPALVYVRGFVQQVARELGARRPEALAQAFATRCKAARGE